MDSPRAKHHGHGGEVAGAQSHERSPDPVGPVPVDQNRPESFHPDGTVVAEGEEGDEEHPAQHRDEEPARGGLLKGKRKGKLV